MVGWWGGGVGGWVMVGGWGWWVVVVGGGGGGGGGWWVVVGVTDMPACTRVDLCSHNSERQSFNACTERRARLDTLD